MQGFTAESSQPCTSDTAQNSQKAIDRASGGTRKCLLSAQHEFKRFFDDIARSTKRPGSVGEHEGLLPNSKSCWCCAGQGAGGEGRREGLHVSFILSLSLSLSLCLSLSLSLHTHTQTHIHIFPSRDVGVANAKLWLTKLNLHKNGGHFAQIVLFSATRPAAFGTTVLEVRFPKAPRMPESVVALCGPYCYNVRL